MSVRNFPQADFIQSAAKTLIGLGYAVCLVHHKTKQAYIVGWTTQSATPEEFQSGDLIGVMAGPLSNGYRAGHALVGVDLDSPDAVQRADEFLPDTGMIDGRPGKPRSHRYYLVPLDTIPEVEHSTANQGAKAAIELYGHPGPRTLSFRKPGEGEAIRICGTGQMLVCPPSTHPSGESRRWVGGPVVGEPGEPEVLPYPDLLAAVKALADAIGCQRRENRIPDLASYRPVSLPTSTVIDRARRYLATVDPAISGQNGHNTTFRAACRLVQGFGLEFDEALSLMANDYNPRCDPPWSLYELQHKVQDAIDAPSDRPRGYMLAERNCHADHAGVDLSKVMPSAKRETSPPSGTPSKPTTDMPTLRPKIVCLNDVTPSVVRWLWPGRIALGRITVLCARPGDGKTFLSCDIAARLSRGVLWPASNDLASIGSSLILNAEDDLEDTIAPRLKSAGADRAKVYAMPAAILTETDGTEKEVAFDLRNVDLIRNAVDNDPDIRLVVIDPIGSYLGGNTDAHRDNEVRSVLHPLNILARERNFAVLLVAHNRKSGATFADDTILGSRAFTGIARTVLHLMRDDEDPTQERRLLLPGKNNLSKQAPGLAFQIADGRIEWEAEPVDRRADDVLQAAQDGAGGRPAEERSKAEEFLRDALRDGPRLAKDLIERAKNGHDISEKTLRRAKDKLGAKADKIADQWWWIMPGDDRTPWEESPPDQESQDQDGQNSSKYDLLATLENSQGNTHVSSEGVLAILEDDQNHPSPDADLIPSAEEAQPRGEPGLGDTEKSALFAVYKTTCNTRGKKAKQVGVLMEEQFKDAAFRDAIASLSNRRLVRVTEEPRGKTRVKLTTKGNSLARKHLGQHLPD